MHELRYNHISDSDIGEKLDNVTFQGVGYEEVMLGEVIRDIDGNALGFQDYYHDEFIPNNAGAQPPATLANSHTLCRQNCNLTGRHCRETADMKASQTMLASLTKFGAMVLTGAAVGSVLPGPTTLVGAGVGAGVGALVVGVEHWSIQEQRKFDLRKCRESYDLCVKGCEAIRPKPVGTGAGGGLL